MTKQDIRAIVEDQDGTRVLADNIAAPEHPQDDLAKKFTQAYGEKLPYVAQTGEWFCFNGVRYAPDTTLSVYDRARAIARIEAQNC